MPIDQHPDYAAARSPDGLPTQFIDLSSVLLADEPSTGSTPVATGREVSPADAAVSLEAGSVSDSEGGARMESAVPSSDPAEPPQSEKLSERIAPTHAVSRSPSPPSDNNSRWLTLGGGVLVAVIAVGFLSARGTRSDDAQTGATSLLAAPNSFGTPFGSDSVVGVGAADSTTPTMAPAEAHGGP